MFPTVSVLILLYSVIIVLTSWIGNLVTAIAVIWSLLFFFILINIYSIANIVIYIFDRSKKIQP